MSILKIDDIFELPGWDTRKRIMEELRSGPKNAYELAKILELNYSTVRYHLELLQKFGLVNVKKGKKYYYELTKTALQILNEEK
ncbi:winged helix-turn-helix domain-containing protein [Sulfurisphaera javensis]|uniref:Winged helix-turn-helix domain-containing protein n=1 Tax=Sulfurisphaera javensis TaxID=2049879 RepID=A0AAT9GNS2_9CREN